MNAIGSAMTLEQAIPLVNAAASVLSAAAVVITVFFASRQLGATRDQLAVTKADIQDLQATRSRQQLYDVVVQLLGIKESVEHVLKLDGTDLSDWSDEAIEAAHVVCSRFHLVGLLVLEGLLPEDLFAKAWFYSVPRCHDILQPFLKKIRSDRDSRYWGAFDVLAAIVRKHADSFEGWDAEVVHRAVRTAVR